MKKGKMSIKTVKANSYQSKQSIDYLLETVMMHIFPIPTIQYNYNTYEYTQIANIEYHCILVL